MARLTGAEAAVDAMVRTHEPALRTMLAYSLQREPAAEGELLRQNRRTALIEAALAPTRDQFDPDALALLTEALLVLLSWALTPGQKRLPFLSRARAPVAPGTPEPTASGVPL